MKKSKSTEQKFNSLLDVVKRFPDEKVCRLYLIQARWNGKPVCPHCGCFRKIYLINDGAILKCADCRKQFTVKVGTIFEDSALPLQKWFMAIYLLTAHKKGISSIQLGKDIGVTQKTAWFMLHRVRYAVRTKAFSKPLKGTIEVDETYIGGKTRGQGSGYSQPNKTPVFGLVKRNGEVRAKIVKHADGKTLKPIIRLNVEPESTIMSDEFGGYYDLKKHFKEHHTVNHGAREYVRGQVHTNTIEGFWALLKRGITGIYHKVSRKHLDKYIDEFEFRYNSRSLKDAERFGSMLNRCSGRLMYSELISIR